MTNECVCCKPPWDFTHKPFPTAACASSKCLAIAECWKLTVSGVTDGNCLDCEAIFNGVHILKHRGGIECFWSREPSVTADSDCNKVTLYSLLFDDADTWTLVALTDNPTPSTDPQWTTSDTLFSCVGSNTFALANTPGGTCNDWPGTVTIVPTICP